MLQGGPSDDQGQRGLGPHVMIMLPEGQPLARWMGEMHGPQGPFVFPGSDGTEFIIPVAPPGTTIRQDSGR